MQLVNFFEFKKSDLDPIKSFHIKDSLNNKIWNGFEINQEIRNQLLQISEDFFNSIEIEADVKDIALCGSLCNYNWSEEYSDFDLHIIINYLDIDENIGLVEKFCDYAKKQWNLQHDIQISGYEVEIAIQDKKDLIEGIESGRMGGVFSLLNNKWIKKPEKIDFKLDEKSIEIKSKSIMDVIDGIEDHINDNSYSEVEGKITKIWKKIKDLRKSGLKSKDGEYSTGNLIFKLLRRNNYISKIMNLKKKAYDNQFN